MLVIILLVFFGLIGLAYLFIAYRAGRRKRHQSGLPAMDQPEEVRHPRATPPGA